jgi:hypothetical protein
MAPPISICDISQPPKISPLALVSAGIARVRKTISPFGARSVVVMLYSVVVKDDQRDATMKTAQRE